MKKIKKKSFKERTARTVAAHKAFLVYCITAGVALGLLAVLLAQDKSPHFGEIGETIKTSAYSISVKSVERTKYRDVFTRQLVGDEEALIIRLSVTNETDEVRSFLPVNDVFLKDNYGSILRLKPVYGIDSPIMAGPVKPGKSVSGDVSFVLENKNASIRLFFDPSWDASPPVSIQL